MIYLDNSATTYPKPQSVINAVNKAMKLYSFNSGRGGYQKSIDASDKIYSVRNKASKFFSAKPQNICFTNNCTTALNMTIKGFLNKGDHVIISNLEHNAVARVVDTLARNDYITYDIFDYSYDYEIVLSNIKALINNNTKLIVCTHSSNVFGFVLPIDMIGKLAKEHGIKFVVDGAQGAGVLDVDIDKMNIDSYCVAGHKGLYGPMATGLAVFNGDYKLNTIIEGGTGTESLRLEQPPAIPERLESGTLNNSGIIGLGAGIDFVKNKGITNIYNHEFKLLNYVYDELSKNERIKLYTPYPERYKTTPILSFNLGDYSSEKTANLLSNRGVAVRAGYHCSGLAHKSMNTLDRGTVRFSPCVFTSQKDCEIFVSLLKKLWLSLYLFYNMCYYN